MAAPEKKPVLVDSDEENDGESNIQIYDQTSGAVTSSTEIPEVGNTDDMGDTVNIDFSLFDFTNQDYLAVKLLLNNFPDVLLPMHKVADCIVDQVEVGSSLRAYERAVGFSTILKCPKESLTGTAPGNKKNDNNNRYSWLATLKKHVTKKNSDIAEYFEKKIGVLMHFRMLNLPQSLCAPIHESLRKDLAWVQTKKCDHLSAEEKESWKLEYILCFCKERLVMGIEATGEENMDDAEEEKNVEMGPPPKKKRKTLGYDFMFLEDEIYQRHSVLDVAFGGKVSRSGDGDDLFHVLVLPFDAWCNAVEEIQQSSAALKELEISQAS